MTPWLDDGDVRLFLGDCVEVMAAMPAESVDAVVCDPPYGLEFMGKEWDSFGGQRTGMTDETRAKQRASGEWWAKNYGGYLSGVPAATTPAQRSAFAAWCETWAREALRVLKPGGHLLAFGGTRTFHRLTCGIEDAGFEVRDCLSYLYGSGFPKSLDVSKAIDRKRDDRDDVLAVTAEIARLRDAVGMTNRDLDAVFGFAGMAGHWTSVKSQPAIPTVEQWAALREMLDPPAWVEAEVWRLNGRKGEPGEAWHDREVVGRGRSAIANKDEGPRHTVGASRAVEFDLTAPATEAAQAWQGWGTALKPGWEPCVVARKPLAGTVAENVQAHGTGALNVDGCRIAGTVPQVTQGVNTNGNGYRVAREAQPSNPHNAGRWPANVALDEAAAAMLDAQSGETSYNPPAEWKSSAERDSGAFLSGVNHDAGTVRSGFGDRGGASRFYYTAKASRADRNTSGATNTHPTVKPTDLMRWLVRLVTPPGGVVLDPFAGSGSTLVAARAEGFRAIGIEREQEYADIIAARLSQLSLFTEGME